MTTYSHTVQVNIQSCINCGGPIALTADQERAFRATHETFYCPVGHRQSYCAESPEERAKRFERELIAQRAKTDQAEAASRAEFKARLAVEAERDKLKKRSRAGVCPCCHRTFKQVAAHMKNKHPEVTP